ncbi:hypothetical protein [Loktanella sp. 3ANDIMAR09]|nr:hypothetical protein [Loktanella sp. 3ANDIMAR09]
MKSFLAALVCAGVITVAANVILTETTPLSSQEAYTSGTFVRVGDN